MLDDLSAVNWSTLTHAYGPADDVPDLLRDLAGGNDKALSRLYGNIWHQGTVYEATAYAVPFLIRILDAPAASPHGVLGLLASIAEGSSYLDVHRRLLPRSKRDTAEVHERMDTELGWVAACCRAVADGTATYLRLLATHPDEDVRAAAADLVGLLGPAGAGDEGAAGLRRATADDPDDLVRAAAVLALAAFAEPVTESLTDPMPLPRLAAAIVTAWQHAGDAAEPLPEAITLIIERDAPDCLRLVERLPTGANNSLAWVVRAIVPHWATQLRLLTAWLRHPDGEVREAAAHAVAGPLHTWRSAAVALAPALLAAQRDPVEAVRTRTLRHLAGAGRTAVDATDLLWAAVERGPLVSGDSIFASERTLAAAALTTLSRLRDPRADAYLAARLRDRPLPLTPLTDAIAALGPWAQACRAVIVDAVEAAAAGYDRARLIRAAGRVGADPAALVPVLRRQVVQHPYSAGTLLGDLGAAAAAALPELTALRASDDTDRQRIAARALWRITGDPDDLLGLLRSQTSDIHALEILAEVGRPAVELAGLLPPMFDDDYEWRVIHAAIAYWHLTGDADPVVPVLVRHIECVPWGVPTVRTLADIGPAANAAIPLLRAQAESPCRQAWSRTPDDNLVAEDEGWATVCAYALARIEGTETGAWPDVPVPRPAQQP